MNSTDFAQIYDDNAEVVWRYLQHKVSSPSLADMLALQVFCEANETMTQYPPRWVPVQHWLLRIAHRIATDHLRAADPCVLLADSFQTRGALE
jgi:DNA-directed RNA polymerase specialized sigma24 family protein